MLKPPSICFAIAFFSITNPHIPANGDTFTSKENGYTIAIPDGWQRCPESTLRQMEKVFKEVVGKEVGYDFGFQASSTNEWETPPYVYVTIHKYSEMGFKGQPSPETLADLVGTLSKSLSDGKFTEPVRKKFGEYTDQKTIAFTDDLFETGNVTYDSERKCWFMSSSSAEHPNHGRVTLYTGGYFGKFGQVKIDLILPVEKEEQFKEARNKILGSVKFLKGFEYASASHAE